MLAATRGTLDGPENAASSPQPTPKPGQLFERMRLTNLGLIQSEFAQ
jgi:hypothetical protein